MRAWLIFLRLRLALVIQEAISSFLRFCDASLRTLHSETSPSCAFALHSAELLNVCSFENEK